MVLNRIMFTMMRFDHLLGLICLYSLFLQTSSNEVPDFKSNSFKTHYVAAVVEYQPEGTPWDLTPDELITKNADNYKNLMNEASYLNADIIVFPEYGLTTLGIPRNREDAKPYLLSIPDVGTNPCDLKSGSAAIQGISCAAKANSIYVVINSGEIRPCIPDSNLNISPCPEDGRFQFNTNVAFDRNGTIVEKYEKGNLYFEDQFDKPNPIRLSSFVADFGVEFGLFTCFDIIFYDPAVALAETGIRNFAFPTAWVDELPFLTAIQSQAAWAFSHNVNLLASGYHQPLGGQLGSGIYNGRYGNLNYTFDPDSGTKIVIAEVPIDPSVSSKILSINKNKLKINKSCQPLEISHNFLREDLQNYTTKVLTLTPETSVNTACTENGFCCTLEYQLDQRNLECNGKTEILQNYRLIAFNGTRTVAAKTDQYDWQVCGVIRCLNETVESCSENDKGSSAIKLPNFVRFKLHSKFNMHREDADKAFLPGLYTLDVEWNLIPYQYFAIDYNSKADDDYMQISSNVLDSVHIQTIAMIKKLYEITNTSTK